MLQALGHVLPIAVAVALSSVPIMATILILLSPNKSRSSLTFLLGWVVGIVLVVVAFTLLARVIPTSSPKQSQVWIGTALVVIGAALVVGAIALWRRGVGKPSNGVPKWLAAVGSLGPWSAFGLALLLNLRPKAILLAAAAGLSLRSDSLSVANTALVIAIYTVISASAVAIPIVARMLAPQRTDKWLVGARKWIAKNNRIVSILIMILIGVVIFSDGLTRL
ncbi:GAP family protein [Rathayibacter soli]|uniref:GAP family protein n=1 Tax=Rathayibacter soli TaxID=3144168 RepID=UPI0027E4BF37|nr:GAP family protein [Glaciibacter superstes]